MIIELPYEEDGGLKESEGLRLEAKGPLLLSASLLLLFMA
jgi:hypothetical protein